MKNCSLWAIFAFSIFVSVLGCEESEISVAAMEPTSTPKEPAVIPVAPNSESLWAEILDERPVSNVLSGSGTPSFYKLVTGEAFVLNAGGSLALQVADEMGSEMFSAMALAPGGEVLLAGAKGVFVVDDMLVPSPLNEKLGEVAVTDMLLAKDSQRTWLWLATTNGIFRWSEGLLEQVVVSRFSTESARLAWGPPVRHGPGLWIVAGGDFYALDSTTSGWRAWEGFRECSPLDVGVNSENGVWLQCQKSLRYRKADGSWHEVLMDSPVVALYTHPQSRSSWLVTEDNRIWHAHDDQLWPVELELPTGGMAVEANGSLLMGTANGLVRVSPGRGILLENMPAKGTLVDDRTITLQLEGGQAISEIRVTLDGEAIALGGDRREFSLDGPQLMEGNHLLEISVAYSDTEQISRSLAHFRVLHPSWQRDIQPISARYCERCHGSEAAVSLKLDTHEDWSAHFSDILDALEGQLMPPGVTLDQEKIGLIRYWNEASQPQ